MNRLRITPSAEADLVDIWLYSCELWGAEQADYYLDQLETGMSSLLDHPYLGTNYDYVLKDYRRLQVKYHAVFYKVLDTEVLIVRVLHEDMDSARRLSETIN